jgi:hypothetical protein
MKNGGEKRAKGGPDAGTGPAGGSVRSVHHDDLAAKETEQ